MNVWGSMVNRGVQVGSCRPLGRGRADPASGGPQGYGLGDTVPNPPGGGESFASSKAVCLGPEPFGGGSPSVAGDGAARWAIPPC